jgi:hypothetical protein
MVKTAKQHHKKNNLTQKNKKNKNFVNSCKYKSCKTKMYNSIYGGRHSSQLFM